MKIHIFTTKKQKRGQDSKDKINAREEKRSN